MLRKNRYLTDEQYTAGVREYHEAFEEVPDLGISRAQPAKALRAEDGARKRSRSIRMPIE
jgi:hypothetical protein